MTYNPENFFDNVGGAGAPSAKLSHVEDFVLGTIEDQFMVPATEFGTDKQKKDTKTGALIEQLVIVLQTDQRDWAGVSKIPLKDKDDKSSGQKDPSEDDGRRAVYVEPWTNIHAAIGAAVREATGAKGPVRNGGTLGVKIVELKDTGKGNPLKIHKAVYTPPAEKAASDAFFDQTSAPQSAPAEEAPAAQEQPKAPAQDPWGQPQAGGSKAPF